MWLIIVLAWPILVSRRYVRCCILYPVRYSAFIIENKFCLEVMFVNFVISLKFELILLFFEFTSY